MMTKFETKPDNAKDVAAADARRELRFVAKVVRGLITKAEDGLDRVIHPEQLTDLYEARDALRRASKVLR